MSPLTTFHNSGSSSIFQRRNTAPSEVMRLSPATLTEDPPCEGVIVRNLTRVNSFPFLPTRFCLKSAGAPGMAIAIAIPVRSRTGKNTARPKMPARRSKISFVSKVKRLCFREESRILSKSLNEVRGYIRMVCLYDPSELQFSENQFIRVHKNTKFAVFVKTF